MRLEDIGFYTLSEARVASSSVNSRMMRAELLLTARCNFHCPYCRGVGGKDVSLVNALEIIRLWTDDGLYALRLSGGEPLLYKGLDTLVRAARGRRSGAHRYLIQRFLPTASLSRADRCRGQ